MSEFQVPDFRSIQEFESWAYKLEDKKIQSWTTKDWLQMYEKLDKIPTPRTETELMLKKDALIKLYRNYRLEEADFKTMQEIGRKIGHNLAQQKMDFDLASVNVDNSFVEGARKQFAQAADKAIYETSQYAKAKDTPLGDYNRVASEISISEADKVNYIGVAREVNEYSSEISLSNTVKKDVFGSTAIHESVHAQLQTLRTGQQEALAKLGLKPEEGFSNDFYKLLQYNDKYYVENTTDSRIYSDLEIKLQESTITQQEFEKLKKAEILKGSAKQPLETQAQIIGLTAEHYYRQETGQLSERAARAVTDVMGKPQLAQYNKKGEINLSYRIENKEAFDKKLSSLAEDKVGKIAAVYDEKRKIYTLTVPSKTTEQEFEKIINSVTSKEMTTVYDGIDINNMGKARPDLDNHIMTPAEQRKNLAFYARAAKEHVGWEGFSEENKRLFQEKIVETYKSISGDCKQAEFMERVAEQTAPFIEDRHFTLATGSKTYLGGISEKSSVGRNIANYSSEEMANLNLNLLDEKVRVNQQGTKEVMWRICTTKVNGEDMLIVSIPQLPNSGDYNASKEFIETFDKIYFDHKEKWDKGRIVLDVRGNLGGEDKPIDHMAKRLYGNSVNTYKRCEIKDTEISNAFLHRHGAYKPNNLQRDGINPEDIVQRKHFSGENKVLFDETGTFYPYNAEKGYHGRIDVLLDRKVSSSAESAYTSFYHHPMVRFIGEHTAGMQQFTQGSFAMPCGYMMRVGVTKLDYWDKEGENIEIKGHKPDIECKGTDAFSVALEKGRDEARVMGIRQSNEPRKGKPVFVEYDPKAPTDPRKAYYARYLEPALAEVETKNKTTVELEHMATKEAQSAEKNALPHRFPSVADMKGIDKVELYHGSRNFFEKYDYTKARTVGGAQFGLGQYFTPKESMAYGYATLDKEKPLIEKNIETNGEKVATQKVVYQGEISGSDLSKILVPEKMRDADYDILIETARKQGKNTLAEELEKIKLTPKDRHIDLCQWLRKTESVDLMQTIGINGIYSPDRDVYAIYDTSKMNIKVKEAIVLDGTDIPKSLIADKSVIHIQSSLAEKAEEAHILTTKGSILERTGKSEGAKITALIEPNASKQATQTAEKTATKSALRAQATNTIIKEVMSNHFDNLNKPAVVSIGLYTKGDYRYTDIKKVVSTLRENGIDAVLATSKEAKDLSKFVIDETGIRTPLLSPKDAKLATKDIIAILDANNIGIMGHALPQTNDNLTYSIFTSQDKGLKEVNIAEKEFVSSQLSKINDLPEVTSFNPNSVYRGGTLGNRPYAVIPAFAHARDCAYGSESVDVARIFTGANKDSWAGRVHYPEVNGKKYGFLYEYEKAPDQIIYNNYGIENRELVSKGTFETPLFEHRNKIKAIYLECDGKIVQIAGENGKYISPEWERFAELHNPTVLSTNMDRIARDNGIKAAAEEGRTVAYTKKDPKILAQKEAAVLLVEQEKKNTAKTTEKVATKTVLETSAKTATKSALRAQATNIAKRTGNTATKAVKSVGNTVLKANAAYDAIFDKNVKILMDMDAPQWMKKVDNAMMKTVNNKATQWTVGKLQAWGEEFVKTPAGKKLQEQVMKSYVKMGGDAMAKSAAKKIPLVCVGIACAMAKERFENGEYVKGGLEVVSGVAACVPVLGTAVSLGIDAGVLASDLYEAGAMSHVSQFFEHGQIQADPNRYVVAESTGYDNRLKRMNETIDRQNKEAKSQKEVRHVAEKMAAEETSRSWKNITNMAPWSENTR